MIMISTRPAFWLLPVIPLLCCSPICVHHMLTCLPAIMGCAGLYWLFWVYFQLSVDLHGYF